MGPLRELRFLTFLANVRLGWKWPAGLSALVDNTATLIIILNGFIVQVPEEKKRLSQKLIFFLSPPISKTFKVAAGPGL